MKGRLRIYSRMKGKRQGLRRTVQQKFAKKNDGFDKNGALDLIGEIEKKMGFGRTVK